MSWKTVLNAHKAMTQTRTIMIDQTMLSKIPDDIREAGYQYACSVYYLGQSSNEFKKVFEDWEEDITKENLEIHFSECACQEGLQTDVWEDFEAKGSEYIDCLKLLDWDEIFEPFSKGGSRRIDEILQDASVTEETASTIGLKAKGHRSSKK